MTRAQRPETVIFVWPKKDFKSEIENVGIEVMTKYHSRLQYWLTSHQGPSSKD